MRSTKQLITAFIVVIVAGFIECGFLYYQASTGRRLPFRLNVFPRFDGEL